MALNDPSLNNPYQVYKQSKCISLKTLALRQGHRCSITMDSYKQQIHKVHCKALFPASTELIKNNIQLK